MTWMWPVNDMNVTYVSLASLCSLTFATSQGVVSKAAVAPEHAPDITFWESYLDTSVFLEFISCEYKS